MGFSSTAVRGSAVSSTTNNTLSVTPTATITSGLIAFASCTTDNLQTTSGNSTLHTVSDSAGNTWSKVFEVTDTNGATSDGNTTSLWYSRITSQLASGASSVTLNLTGSVSDRIISLMSTDLTSGKTVNYYTSYVAATGGTSLTKSLTGLPTNEYLFFGLFGAEGEDTAKSQMTNYTERFDLTSATAGNADVNVQQHVQTRRFVGSSGDTVTSSGVTFTNGIQSLTAFYEIDIPIPSGSYIKYWDGDSWESKPLKTWNGSSWETANLKVYNGSTWDLE